MTKSKRLTFQTKHFSELTTHELYQILQLRSEVFVVEQDCVYQDMDGLDYDAYHVIRQDQNGQLLSYTRLLDVGVSYPDAASIGRVITHESLRGTGEGIALMKRSLNDINHMYPSSKIKISAQAHLEGWYSQFGFKSIGKQYLEDDIPHICMELINENI